MSELDQHTFPQISAEFEILERNYALKRDYLNAYVCKGLSKVALSFAPGVQEDSELKEIRSIFEEILLLEGLSLRANKEKIES